MVTALEGYRRMKVRVWEVNYLEIYDVWLDLTWTLWILCLLILLELYGSYVKSMDLGWKIVCLILLFSFLCKVHHLESGERSIKNFRFLIFSWIMSLDSKVWWYAWCVLWPLTAIYLIYLKCDLIKNTIKAKALLINFFFLNNAAKIQPSVHARELGGVSTTTGAWKLS